MRAILIHGMGRTPAGMLILAARLRALGFRPVLFGYSATLERWAGCLTRLEHFIEKHTGADRFIIVSHSLGTVLTRAVLSKLNRKPVACFLLSPPTQACLAARTFASRRFYRLFTGEMGQLLASHQFMDSLPLPDVPTKIYAGTGGPTGLFSPFGKEPNDGVLTVKETMLPSVSVQTVPSLHTFIMNSKIVAQDIAKVTQSLSSSGADSGSRMLKRAARPGAV
ncbi:alpha/beta hydrolase [Methylocaldum sp.]|uniref:esterase/lipase family protein n=1 Tax=Methylocaldum sp. TaxID=1969727 RepID=UPI002D28CC3B|nr:alpha/beta hydrolase [Methylocaldum sp.]HYE35654.1 alpha/beta hydrolase [Methylocaldum sp.]